VGLGGALTSARTATQPDWDQERNAYGARQPNLHDSILSERAWPYASHYALRQRALGSIIRSVAQGGAAIRKIRWTWTALGAAAVLLVVAEPLGAARSGAQTAPQTTSPSSGKKCVGPHKTRTDGRGAKFFYFTDPNTGVESWQVEPPPGFDPTAASDTDLTTYEYPPRPPAGAPAQEMATWVAITKAKRQASSQLCVIANSMAGSGQHNVAPSPTWSGVFDDTNWGYQFVTVWGYFQQTGFGGTCYNTEGSASWIGLGGWNPTQPPFAALMQVGTVNDSMNTGNRIMPFDEWISKNGVDTGGRDYSGGSVNPGDSVANFLTYNPGNGLLQAYVYDASIKPNGAYWPDQQALDPNLYFNGTTGDFIDERPFNYNTGQNDNLRQWYLHTINWTFGQVATADGRRVGTGADYHSLIQMQGQGGINHILATIFSDVATDTTWTNNWQGCH
jgi:hypothetical protein